ncbi:MAG TPA: serine O-acetyltransferase EpsC [Acidobacteriota bacterium]|nr:serine O-acetyltransferase EpsC [Acidobacteriota bacterium]
MVLRKTTLNTRAELKETEISDSRNIEVTDMDDLDHSSITAVARRLVTANQELAFKTQNVKTCRAELPSRVSCLKVMQQLRSILFPGYFHLSEFSDEGIGFHVGAILDLISINLREQIKRGFCFGCVDDGTEHRCSERAEVLTREFLARLPDVMALLGEDVHAAYEGDPAAKSPGETILCYPGVFAITNHRIAHELYKLDVPVIPRIISEDAHSVTGIDIHPGARIGRKFFIDHGTGVVIGETTIIGDRVRIYQGVTLGAKSFPLNEKGNPIKGIDRHPIIEDDVIIYAGATILGRITIGARSTIGGNVWLTDSVPPDSSISQGREPRAR